jgi:putative aldouronate transport system permease protein
MPELKKRARYNKIKVFDVLLYIFMIIWAFITAFPFYNMIITSFANYEAVQSQAIYLWPSTIDLTAYKMVFEAKNFISAMGVSLFITVVGTALGIVISIAGAYPMSKKNVPGNRIMFYIVIITMFFSGGMIPTYLIVAQTLNLKDNIWALILPSLTGAFNVILLKNFFEELPAELEESAKIDGANDFVILFKIVIPMSTPVIATICLFLAVGKWNEYMNAILYIMDEYKKPLQLVLRNVLNNASNTLSGVAQAKASQEKPFYNLSLQMAIVTIATIPILLVYPFVQKYFTAGIMLGAVKG